MTYPPPSGPQPDPNHQAGQGQPGLNQAHGQPPGGSQPVYGQQQPYGSPQGTQPGFPPPPGFGPPPRRSKAGLVIGLCAAGFGVVLLVVILVLTLGSATPTSVAQRYIAAAEDGDLDTLRSLTCGQLKSDFDVPDSEVEEAAAQLTEFFSQHDFEFLGEVIDGDKATVTIRITGPEEDSTGEMKLVDEEGWKVCQTL